MAYNFGLLLFQKHWKEWQLSLRWRHNGRDVDDLISSVNKELVNNTEWLDASKLSINVSKTYYIIFRPQGMRNPVVTRPLIIKDETINVTIKLNFGQSSGMKS